MTCACNDPVPILSVPSTPLYPYEISPQGMNGSYVVPPQTIFIFPVWLCPGQRLDIVSAHNAPEAPDYSIRLWLTDTVIGAPLAKMPSYLKTWDANKIIPRCVTVYDHDEAAPADSILPAPLATGPLLLHVHNLTNFVNRFSLQITACGVQGG